MVAEKENVHRWIMYKPPELCGTFPRHLLSRCGVRAVRCAAATLGEAVDQRRRESTRWVRRRWAPWLTGRDLSRWPGLDLFGSRVGRCASRTERKNSLPHRNAICQVTREECRSRTCNTCEAQSCTHCYALIPRLSQRGDRRHRTCRSHL